MKIMEELIALNRGNTEILSRLNELKSVLQDLHHQVDPIQAEQIDASARQSFLD